MPNTRFPNLFIIGAPKCGTTALSHYLAGHPQVFMTETAGMKEPHYFNSDLKVSHLYWRIHDEHAYLQLFEKANPHAAYWGEASPLYLFSEQAVPRILKKCDDPRFIVMLRNPIDLAYSQHNENWKSYGGYPNFEACWRLQESRLNGHNLPEKFSDGIALQYGQIAKTGAQLERLLARVELRQVHIVLYDDFSANTAASYTATLDWLGLTHDSRTLFERLNPSVAYKWLGLENSLRKFRNLRSSLGLPGGLGIHNLIDRFNKKNVRKPLRQRFRQELCEYFCDDVNLLSRLLGRDLSHWLTSSPAHIKTVDETHLPTPA